GIRMRIGLSQIEDTSNSKMNHADERREDSSPSRASPRSVKLRDLMQGTEASIPASAQDLEIRQVACDSRKVQLRALFFALHGAQADGNTFIRDAVSRGAAAIASEEPAPAAIPSSVAWIRVRAARKALAIAAANLFRHPAQRVPLVAGSGSDGKTTTTSLVDSIVKASGAKTGLFGTIAYHTPL